MNLKEAKVLVHKHDTGICDKFYQTSRSTWVCLRIRIGSHTWCGSGKAVYNPNDARNPRLQWNAGKGYNIARGRAVADIARQLLVEQLYREMGSPPFEKAALAIDHAAALFNLATVTA